MPAHGLFNIDWLVANAQRHYPLTVDSTGRDTTGAFALPDDFLVGLDLPVHAGNDVSPERFFVRRVGVYATGFQVVVGYQPAGDVDPIDVALALVPRQGHVRNRTYAMGGVDDFADTIGKVTIGMLEGIDEQPAGLFEFAIGDARIEPDCIRPVLRGVSSLRVVNGAESSEPMYGDVELVAQENVQLTPVVVSGQDPRILISAIKGEGTIQQCVCEGDTDAPAIKRINGVPPTPAGDFTILGNPCLSVQAISNGLRLRDTCSEPCCGCAELEEITRQLEQFGSQRTTLENFISRLEAAVAQTDAVILGSKVGDRGCSVPCAEDQ